tara:strand:+ start:222 stop:635 length:414 start_codon:yes stop_codon:yes gene_type:complete
MFYHLKKFPKIIVITTAMNYPHLAWGQGIAGDLIICNRTLEEVRDGANNACTLNDLIIVADRLINLIIQLALAFTILIMLITGARYIFAGSADAKSIAKKSFKKLAIGFAFIVGAYLIVNTLFYIAGVKDTIFNFLG